VLPVKYELRFYIPEDDILHSHLRENLKSYIDMEIDVREIGLVLWTGLSGSGCGPE
jgi:hypothetical protein